MPRNQDQVPHQGRQSGKSSNRFFGGTGHPKGNGASTGNGTTGSKVTSDSPTGIVDGIRMIFRKGNR
jgi:hypothetical protein